MIEWHRPIASWRRQLAVSKGAKAKLTKKATDPAINSIGCRHQDPRTGERCGAACEGAYCDKHRVESPPPKRGAGMRNYEKKS